MDNPASFHSFSGLSASEIAAIQAAAFERKFMAIVAPLMAIVAPLIPAQTPMVPVCGEGDRLPAVAHSAVPTTPRDDIVHPAAVPANLTTTEVFQPLRSVVMRGGSLFISVPAYPEQRQPSDSLPDLPKEEKQAISQAVEEKPRLPLLKKKKPRLPKSQQQQNATSQKPSQPARRLSYAQKRAEFHQRMKKSYPFKRKSIKKIFNYLLKRSDFHLPKPRKPDQVGKSGEPNYCPYHQMTGHILEDCVAFKEWLEKALKEGKLALPNSCLVDPHSRSRKAT